MDCSIISGEVIPLSGVVRGAPPLRKRVPLFEPDGCEYSLVGDFHVSGGRIENPE